MGDTAELIARLRALVILDEVHSDNPLGREAADAISSLVMERDEAREAAYDQPHGPTSRILWSTRYGELLDDYKDLQAENEKMREDCGTYKPRIFSLTEQVARLTRERDDALATISLLQSQCRKQQEHDTAIIEGLTLDVNRYAYERDNAREERDKAERRSEAFWKPQVEAAEAAVSRLRAENAAQNRHGPIKGIRKMSDAALQLLLSNTSEGGKDE